MRKNPNQKILFLIFSILFCSLISHADDVATMYSESPALIHSTDGMQPPIGYQTEAPVGDIGPNDGIPLIRQKWSNVYGSAFCDQAKKYEAEFAPDDTAHKNPHLTLKLFFGDMIDSDQLAILTGPACKVFDKMTATIYREIKVPKSKFARDRPYFKHPEFNSGNLSCPHTVEEKDHESFPSFHSAMSIAEAHLLDQLLPPSAHSPLGVSVAADVRDANSVLRNVSDPYLMNFQDKFAGRAQEIRESRNVLAVHYPSDVAVGKQVGENVFGALQADPQFKSDVQMCRDALATVKKPCP